MLIQETWRNVTDGFPCGESDLYEPFTDNPGKLYRFLVKEYGRCISKVYVDNPNKSVSAIGWVFVKREKYDDSKDTYLLETWVTLHDNKPETKKTYHYHELKG